MWLEIKSSKTSERIRTMYTLMRGKLLPNSAQQIRYWGRHVCNHKCSSPNGNLMREKCTLARTEVATRVKVARRARAIALGRVCAFAKDEYLQGRAD